ncbi:MAG: 16S rRNA (cytosine(1402)-N(4))-methyltransferase RsmH [Holosporaceae bacterium]|jgi:16S rRNA (cytosine1402-N4)-methyltransferase|nr:16S rRNA (cytosine(1402)-N(4))-methyltransferase RsmH [Holosporaceae bacterium]
MAKQEHIPVLLPEVLCMLNPRDGGVYFDGTFGGGGYARGILEAADCSVIAVDRDIAVEPIAEDFRTNYPQRFVFFHAKFSDLKKLVNHKLDGIVLDLGVSSFQLANPGRGFSFNLPGPVDMRMGLCEEAAFDVLHKYSEKELANIIYEFGEEHFSRRIAKNIKLNLDRIHSTEDLANIVRSCVKRYSRIDPSTKTFQSLRIFVNDELGELRSILHDSVDLLNPGGKIIVVSFHSLEDRIVKLFFRKLAASEKRSKFKLLTKKPIVPSPGEMRGNSRSRSAKLRGISMLH